MRYSTKLLRTTLAASLMLAAIAGIVSPPSRHLAFLSMNAFAQEHQSKAITFLTGECRFQLVQGFFPCQKTVMWLETKNGRTVVSFLKTTLHSAYPAEVMAAKPGKLLPFRRYRPCNAKGKA